MPPLAPSFSSQGPRKRIDARTTRPAPKGAFDGLVSSPDNLNLLLENDHVRVLQYTLLPGALDHWHTHPPRVGYVLSGAKIRVTEADGSHEDYDEKTGDNYWADLSPLHDTQIRAEVAQAVRILSAAGSVL